jgi:sec-independent protein translocase protein TatA
MFGKLGVTELLLILAIVVVLFGATKIPQLGKGLGEGIRNFKKGLRNEDAPRQLEGAEHSKDS